MNNTPPEKSNGSAAVGVVIGLLLAYPISYWFQPGALRAKMSLGNYFEHFGDVIKTDDLRSAVIISFIACPIVFGLLSKLITARK